MIGETSDSITQRFGQAGTPDMREVRWERQLVTVRLQSTPIPTYVYMDKLYIDWQVEGLNLTPLFVYYTSLSYQQMMASAGNSHLMFHPVRGWIPIVDHLHQHNPGMLLRSSHVIGFSVLCAW